jgi:hypothetical protein
MADGTVLQITKEVTDITVSEEVVTIDISPEIVELTTSLAFPSLSANDIVVQPYHTITQTTLQGALNQLADQDFRSSNTPTGSNIEEGDTWYNIETDQFYVYRRVSETTLAWVPIMVGNESPDSDTLDAGAF